LADARAPYASQHEQDPNQRREHRALQ
jgi:hypothetical protein